MKEWKKNAREISAGAKTDDILEDRDARCGQAVRKMPGWKAPGPDKIHGWWHKVPPKTNSLLMDKMWEIMDGAGKMTDWMVRGKTVMIPKEGCVGKAEQFRPIACLNTSNKLLTCALAGMITEHTLRVGVLPAEQKAIRKGTGACQDALTVNMAVANEAKRDKRDLSVAWVDYRKAYDLVPHRWLKAMLWAVRAPKPIRALVRQVVKMWATDLCLWTPDGPKHIPMDMKRGIYQGDSLSP